jgi:hypothetical protein
MSRVGRIPAPGKAKAALGRLRPELRLLNESAVPSLDRRLDETLTLHRLRLFRDLGMSLKTTNVSSRSITLSSKQRVTKVDRCGN